VALVTPVLRLCRSCRDRPAFGPTTVERLCLHRPAPSLLGGVVSRLLAQPALRTEPVFLCGNRGDSWDASRHTAWPVVRPLSHPHDTQPLRPRRQVIKFIPSHHCSTHTWGLRLKKPLDLRSGASPYTRGLRLSTDARGLRLSTHTWGLRLKNRSIYARGLRPMLGGFALCSGASPLD
jgi:hypothetical protein